MDALADQAKRWQMKAEECRAVAEQMKNPMAQASFRQMAATYDQLAEGLERSTAPAREKKPEAG